MYEYNSYLLGISFRKKNSLKTLINDIKIKKYRSP